LKGLFLALAVALVLSGCGNPIPEEAVIHERARGIERYAFSGGGRQLSYTVTMKFPENVLTDSHFSRLAASGWMKCGPGSDAWDSFVDSSNAPNDKTIFQKNSYWAKDAALLTISMRYYASVSGTKRRIAAPDNDEQHVVVLLATAGGVKEKLGLVCPGGR
jgi:hypothetical protein